MTIMNLPKTPKEYVWKIDTSLTTEDLARNQVQVTLYRYLPVPIVRLRRAIETTTFEIAKPKKRTKRIEKAAKTIWEHEQQRAYQKSMDDYANYLNAENMRIMRSH